MLHQRKVQVSRLNLSTDRFNILEIREIFTSPKLPGELERLCCAVDKERLKYAEAKEAAVRGENHLPFHYSALRDKHGVGGPG